MLDMTLPWRETGNEERRLVAFVVKVFWKKFQSNNKFIIGFLLASK